NYVGGTWYYFENGEKVTNAWRLDSTGWCFLDEEGKWVIDAFVRDSVGLAYITADGYFYYDRNGWIDYHGTWYYLENGYAVVNNWRLDSVGWCYLGEDGAMLTNAWMKDSVGWCYLDDSGYWDGIYYDEASSDPWKYKNGGNDYIVKYNSTTSENIVIGTSHIDVPEDDPDGKYIIVCDIQRKHITQIGEWIYFDEVVKYHDEYIVNTPGNHPGIGGVIRNFCRIKQDGTTFEMLSTISPNTLDSLDYVLGYDGSLVYFLKRSENQLGPGGGKICSLDLLSPFTNIIDEATVYDKFIITPLNSYIENGVIYITGNPELGEEDCTISIESLK
ncbi:MAG: hypothetical protein IJ292_01580, partial [Clostridia bacterium]|nr:hypothetical protein [Clostridia bacterium]